MWRIVEVNWHTAVHLGCWCWHYSLTYISAADMSIFTFSEKPILQKGSIFFLAQMHEGPPVDERISWTTNRDTVQITWAATSLPMKHYEAVENATACESQGEIQTPARKPVVFVITENETCGTHEGFMSCCVSLSTKNVLTMTAPYPSTSNGGIPAQRLKYTLVFSIFWLSFTF